jgi:hypothetical protein
MGDGFITRKGGGGIDVSDAIATQSDVLQGQTFYAGEDKEIKTGTIPSKGSETFTPGTTNQTISAGQYLSGTQTILGDVDLTPNNIRENTTVFGVTGTLVPTPFLTASGGTINTYSSGGKNYRVHTFTSSENFVVSEGNTNIIKDNVVDYLIIAGGGGGGSDVAGGGGGAGGYRTTLGTSGGNSTAESNITVTAQTFGITIGAGGLGQKASFQTTPPAPSSPTSGSNSFALGISSIGGGKGGYLVFSNDFTEFNGGSGGGGLGDFFFDTQGGLGTPGQGSNGGNAEYFYAGGGGGAGQVGGNGIETGGGFGRAGNGGNGLANTLRTGSNETRAGGGAGANAGPSNTGFPTPGTGGGGEGATSLNSPATSGAINTGSGGGGGNEFWSNGGNGGSGIVIIRYEVGEL